VSQKIASKTEFFHTTTDTPHLSTDIVSSVRSGYIFCLLGRTKGHVEAVIMLLQAALGKQNIKRAKQAKYCTVAVL
jgi:hypothetical protein